MHTTFTCSPVGNQNKKAKPTEEAAAAAAAEEEEEEAKNTLTSPAKASGRDSMSPSNFIASASNF